MVSEFAVHGCLTLVWYHISWWQHTVDEVAHLTAFVTQRGMSWSFYTLFKCTSQGPNFLLVGLTSSISEPPRAARVRTNNLMCGLLGESLDPNHSKFQTSYLTSNFIKMIKLKSFCFYSPPKEEGIL